MRTKWISLLLLLALLCPRALAAGEIDLSPAPRTEEAAGGETTLAPLSEAPLEPSVPIAASCAALMLVEQESGQVIFEMNPDAPRPVASVTKVMTILLALEMIDSGRLSLDDVVSVSRAAAGMGGSQVLLDAGERQTVRVLIESMIVGSANDAAVAMAEAMFGSE